MATIQLSSSSVSLKDKVDLLGDQIKEIAQKIATEISHPLHQVLNTISLFQDGNTVPFIARYRKEVTGALDETQLRAVNESLERLTQVYAKREKIFEALSAQGLLTDALKTALLQAEKLSELDSIYEPFKPKRQSRYQKAMDAGLEPLALALLHKNEQELDTIAQSLICENYSNPVEVYQGARDILAEKLSQHIESREMISAYLEDYLEINTGMKKDADQLENFQLYEMYFQFNATLPKLKDHQALAIRRGVIDKILSLKLDLKERSLVDRLNQKASILFETKNLTQAQSMQLEFVVNDAFDRLIFPSISNHLWVDRLERADQQAIASFSINLKGLLLQSPCPQKRVLGVDPGLRTGCKCAVINAQGDLEHTFVFYSHDQRKNAEIQNLANVYQKYKIDVVSVGNGTGTTEAQEIVCKAIELSQTDVKYAVVDEAGASVYSASEVAIQEFPDLDVSFRGAVSIARRFQDPLAELVKIEPKSIGVGMYQHDVPQTELEQSLDGVIEDVVSGVGVDVNTASAQLLKHVAGVGGKVAKSIVAHRSAFGPFKSRAELLKVRGLGPKTFEQCAGFLRIREGEDPLDNTAVHPESYPFVRKVLDQLGEKIGPHLKAKINELKKFGQQIAQEYQLGAYTITDTLDALMKPGRDPRDELPPPILKSGQLKIEDLKTGQMLLGKIKNVVDFGAFVDIGLKQDGMVHISELSDRFVSNPYEVVKVGQQVEARVLSVDLAKGRIALSLKSENTQGQGQGQGQRNQNQGKYQGQEGGYNRNQSGSQGGRNQQFGNSSSSFNSGAFGNLSQFMPKNQK